MKKSRFAEVAPAVPLSQAGTKTYTYRVPAGLPTLKLFTKVSVPFGKRVIPGIIIATHNRSPKYPTKTLQLSGAASTLTDPQIEFARWLNYVHGGSLGYTLRLFFPGTSTPSSNIFAKKSSLTATSPKVTPPPGFAVALKAGHAAYIERDNTLRAKTLLHLAAAYATYAKPVLMIVPEKWFLPVFAQAAAPWFEASDVAIISSGEKGSLQSAAWEAVRTQNVKLIIGTQKALFLPYHNVSLIILDEEQYSTHKLWDQYPRLHNAYGVRELARIHGARQVIAASFPSLDLQASIQASVLQPVHQNPVRPKCSIFAFSPNDFRHKYVLPNEFVSKLRTWLTDEETVFLFLQRPPAEQATLQTALKALFPRLSQHLLVGTSAILSKIQAEKTPINRAVWLFPERSLNISDYRSVEQALILTARLQQLISARRKIVLVTRQPAVIDKYLNRPLAEVMAEQLRERRRLNFPPFSDMVKLTVAATTKKAAFKKAAVIREKIDERLTQSEYQVSSIKYQIYGPFHEYAAKDPAAHLLLTGPLAELLPLYSGLPFTWADLAPAKIF